MRKMIINFNILETFMDISVLNGCRENEEESKKWGEGGSNKSERTLIRLISPLLLKRRLFSLNKKRKKIGPRALLWPPVFLWGRRIYDYKFFQSINAVLFYWVFLLIYLGIWNISKVNSSLKALSILLFFWEQNCILLIFYYVQLEYVPFNMNLILCWFKAEI